MVIQTPNSPSAEKIDEIKKQTEEVTEILQTNVEMIKNRGEGFDSMQAKSNDIEMGSGQFARQSETVARRQWWHMTKYRLFIVLTVLFLIACFVAGAFFWNWRDKQPKKPGENYYTPLGPEDETREYEEVPP